MSLQRYNRDFCWPEITQWNSKHFLKYVYFMRGFEFPPTCWPYESFIFNFTFPPSPEYISETLSTFTFSIFSDNPKGFHHLHVHIGFGTLLQAPTRNSLCFLSISSNRKNTIKNNIFSFHARKLCISTQPKEPHCSANAFAFL